MKCHSSERCNRSQGRSRKNTIRSVFAEFFFGIYWLKEESVRLSTNYRRIQMAHIIDGRPEMESVCFWPQLPGTIHFSWQSISSSCRWFISKMSWNADVAAWMWWIRYDRMKCTAPSSSTVVAHAIFGQMCALLYFQSASSVEMSDTSQQNGVDSMKKNNFDTKQKDTMTGVIWAV